MPGRTGSRAAVVHVNGKAAHRGWKEGSELTWKRSEGRMSSPAHGISNRSILIRLSIAFLKGFHLFCIIISSVCVHACVHACMGADACVGQGIGSSWRLSYWQL